MKFCKVCENMLYLSVNNDSLQYYCKNCNFSTEESCAARAECIVNSHFSNGNHGNYEQYMTKYIKHDPTLPRVNNIPCPACASAKKDDDVNANADEVIYLKYDHANMKFLYYCCKCEHFWK